MSDLIDRQAAIDAFKNATADGDKFEWCEWVLKRLPSAQPEWIPCSERLPEVGQIVLKSIKGFGWNGEEYFSVSIGTYNTNDGSILAWMPLPEPWRGEQDDE